VQDLIFESDLFLPILPEECQTAPGVYGFELAVWAARTLAQRGFVTEYPGSEDWGWYIRHGEGEKEVTIGCSSVGQPGEGYTGSPLSWRISCRSSGGRPGWFSSRADTNKTRRAKILAALEKALTEGGIEVRRQPG
jgi:hypothetical protein